MQLGTARSLTVPVTSPWPGDEGVMGFTSEACSSLTEPPIASVLTAMSHTVTTPPFCILTFFLTQEASVIGSVAFKLRAVFFFFFNLNLVFLLLSIGNSAVIHPRVLTSLQNPDFNYPR